MFLLFAVFNLCFSGSVDNSNFIPCSMTFAERNCFKKISIPTLETIEIIEPPIIKALNFDLDPSKKLTFTPKLSKSRPIPITNKNDYSIPQKSNFNMEDVYLPNGDSVVEPDFEIGQGIEIEDMKEQVEEEALFDFED